MTQLNDGRVVLGFAGTLADIARLRHLVGLGTVVATVTVDLGQAVDVEHVREQAVAVGATRAHVFDLREEFARDVVIPAIRSTELATIAARLRAAPFVRRKLDEVALIEHTARVECAEAFDAPLDGARGHYGSRTLVERPVTAPSGAPDTPAHVALEIEAGTPVAINGVPLSVAELLESLALIGGQHAIGRLPQIDAPAVAIVHAAYRALDGCDGVVRFRLHKGELSVLPAHDPNPILVNQA